MCFLLPKLHFFSQILVFLMPELRCRAPELIFLAPKLSFLVPKLSFLVPKVRCLLRIRTRFYQVLHSFNRLWHWGYLLHHSTYLLLCSSAPRILSAASCICSCTIRISSLADLKPSSKFSSVSPILFTDQNQCKPVAVARFPKPLRQCAEPWRTEVLIGRTSNREPQDQQRCAERSGWCRGWCSFGAQ